MKNEDILGEVLEESEIIRNLEEDEKQFDELFIFSDPQFHPLLKNIIKNNLEIPTLGHELLDDSGKIIAEAEFAWLTKKLCILNERQSENSKKFEKASWTVLNPSDPNIIKQIPKRND